MSLHSVSRTNQQKTKRTLEVRFWQLHISYDLASVFWLTQRLKVKIPVSWYSRVKGIDVIILQHDFVIKCLLLSQSLFYLQLKRESTFFRTLIFRSSRDRRGVLVLSVFKWDYLGDGINLTTKNQVLPTTLIMSEVGVSIIFPPSPLPFGSVS